jgi:heterodisulfide reductase subunit B
MKKISVLILAFGLFASCQKKEEKKVETEKCSAEKGKKLEMYQMSEMAALMEQMYVDNQRLKERIQKGDTIGQFPQHFLKIHKAAMTDESENDEFFKEQAAKFIKAQELIYKDPENAKEHFNEGVDACLQCHKQKCGGPIPRIKKLYIE